MCMDNPRVAMICHEYPPYSIGGVGSYCYDLSRFVSRKKVPTVVLCGRSPRRRIERVNDYLTVVRLPFPDIALRAYWFQLRNTSFFRSALREVDLVHAISPQSSAITAILRPPHIPFVTTIHNVPRYWSKAFFSADLHDWTLSEFLFSCCEMPVDEILYKLCFRNSSRVVSVSHSTLQQAKAIFTGTAVDKMTVIPNGVDFEEIENAKRDCEHARLAEHADILFFGRFAWMKGANHVIEAASILRRDSPKIRINLVGTGPLFHRLRERVRVLGLGENVRFLGYQPLHSLIREVMRSSVVALPSSYEGQPVSVFEAMACRKPVVAFDYPFSREVIRDRRTGLLARPGDSRDLSAKIRMLLDDQRLCKTLGNNAFEYAFKEHNWDLLADEYVELYRGIES